MGTAKWAFYVLSCIAFAAVIVLIWGILRSEAAKLTAGELKTYNTMTGILTFLWCIYPIVWLVGTEGLGMVNGAMEAFLYMMLDVAAKFGFGLILLSSVRRLVPKQAKSEMQDILVPATA